MLSRGSPRCPPSGRHDLALEDLHLPLALASSRLEGMPARARTSGGTVSVGLGVRLEPSATVTLRDIRVAAVELKPVLVDYLCQPYAVSGPLELIGEASFVSADPWGSLAGRGFFRIGRGEVLGVGMLGLMNEAARVGSALASVLLPERRPWSREAPPDFDAISGTYRMDAGVLSTQDLLYESRRLRAKARGTYRVGDGRMDMAVELSQGPTEVRVRASGLPGAVTIVPTGVTAEPGEVRRLLDRLGR